ncbi:16S rRNA (uracil(1498)-N(3))-methyltransferase [Corynebacterium sp.]|uniref:16S rRNA (uracil(1498)-N(3))-methyltransferase n=1 Tax=Corynebacterium sp. TaxID=1720 RepID=UPI0025C2E121|nr:16S rRNA (uracil(1498)-N(3))-methyltransferase [Corynebacterium sp.]
MTDPVFVVPDLVDQLAGVGDTGVFSLPDAEARHASVKRMRQGEPVVLTDGSGTGVAGDWNGDGTVVGRHRVEGRPPRPRVTVVQAIPKSDRAELAVDLAVQAGADRIIPWQADRCVSRWTGGKSGKSDKARARWTATAVSAMKQSRRLSGAHVGELLPDIGDLHAHLAPRPWDGPATSGSPTVQVLVLHEEAATPLAQVDLDVDEVVLVIGPEGGVSDREIRAVTSSTGGHRPGRAVVLGPEVLRTATAAAVALGALGVLTTRWGR